MLEAYVDPATAGQAGQDVREKQRSLKAETKRACHAAKARCRMHCHP